MCELLSNNSLFVSQFNEDKSLALHTRDLMFFTTTNGELLLNNSLLELIYFLNMVSLSLLADRTVDAKMFERLRLFISNYQAFRY